MTLLDELPHNHPSLLSQKIDALTDRVDALHEEQQYQQRLMMASLFTVVMTLATAMISLMLRLG